MSYYTITLTAIDLLKREKYLQVKILGIGILEMCMGTEKSIYKIFLNFDNFYNLLETAYTSVLTKLIEKKFGIFSKQFKKYIFFFKCSSALQIFLCR